MKLPMFFRINRIFLDKEILILLYENYFYIVIRLMLIYNYKKRRCNIHKNNSCLS